MRLDRIDSAIIIMKRATMLHMHRWQNNFNHQLKIKQDEIQLHLCGNTACFAGYIAVSSEFQQDGGSVDLLNGAPFYQDRRGSHAVRLWLELSLPLAEQLVYGKKILDQPVGPMSGYEYSTFYNKQFDQVIPQDIIDKLEDIKNGVLQ